MRRRRRSLRRRRRTERTCSSRARVRRGSVERLLSSLAQQAEARTEERHHHIRLQIRRRRGRGLPTARQHNSGSRPLRIDPLRIDCPQCIIVLLRLRGLQVRGPFVVRTSSLFFLRLQFSTCTVSMGLFLPRTRSLLLHPQFSIVSMTCTDAAVLRIWPRFFPSNVPLATTPDGGAGRGRLSPSTRTHATRAQHATRASSRSWRRRLITHRTG